MQGVIVGHIDGFIVRYDNESNTIYCKDQEVDYDKLQEAYDGGFDRYMLRKGFIFRRVSDSQIMIGCLETTDDNIKEIRKQINLIKNRKHVSN